MLFGTTNASTYDFQITITSSNTIEFYSYRASSQQFDLITSQVLRDPSAWYHLVAVLDTTNGTSTDRVRLYLNGKRITAFGTASYPSSGATTPLGDGYTFGLGARSSTGSYNNGFDGYLAETHFIDGTAYDATAFGETKNGVWIPKQFAGTYGTNGFYLKYADGGALGTDSSGNSNTWTATNLASTDVMLDSPTNNFATLNPLKKLNQDTYQGNLRRGVPSWYQQPKLLKATWSYCGCRRGS